MDLGSVRVHSGAVAQAKSAEYGARAFAHGSDIWLDNEYVGSSEGYFAPHEFEITELMAAGGEHVLGVEVFSPKPDGVDNKRAVTGLFDDSEALDTSWNAGGIWRAVRVERSGPVRISGLRVLCTEADASQALSPIGESRPCVQRTCGPHRGDCASF